MTPDYFVRYLPFPARVGAVVVPNDDSSFDIYISSHLSDEAQKERLAHELTHIREDHFYRAIPVALAEAEAQGAPLAQLPAAAAAPPAPPPKPPLVWPRPPSLAPAGQFTLREGVAAGDGGVVTPTPADEWLLSWQKAMAWAEEMIQQRGWPDAG